MTDELTIYQGDELPKMLDLARALKGATGLVPEHLKTEGQILATILAGRELGLGPMAAMRGLHVVKGKVGADYSLWIAQLRRHGYKVEWLASTAEKATLKLTSPQGATHVETWDKARAQTAGLWGGNSWKTYPEAMLRARCVTSAGRAFAAEVMFGAYSLDEIEEIRDADVQVIDDRKGNEGLAAKLGITEQPKPEETADADAPVQLDVATIVGGINDAETPDELAKWAEQAKGLNGAERTEARDAYKARVTFLQQRDAQEVGP